MEKYQNLLKKKNKLEEKIAKLCNQFTNNTGLIVRNASMDIYVLKKENFDLTEKIISDYKVNINCEI